MNCYQDMLAPGMSCADMLRYLTFQMVEAQLHRRFETTSRMGEISLRISGLFAMLHTKIGQFPQ